MDTDTIAPRSKPELLQQRLLDEIVTRPEGARLPTVAQLMEQYQVSRTTVDRALRCLKEKQYIEATVGRGIFTRRPAHRERESLERVDYLVFGNEQVMAGRSFHAELVEQITRRFGQESTWLRTTLLPPNADSDEVAAVIDRLQPQAVLVINARHGEVADVLRRKQVPAVFLFPTTVDQPSNAILIDNRQIASHWVNHLVGLGHRRIALLSPLDRQTYVRDFWQRQQFFYEEMGRRSLPVDPALVFDGGHSPEDGRRATERLLASGADFTAIICGDNAASGVYDALLARGLTPGLEVSVIGVDDESCAAHLRPPLTTVRVPKDVIADVAARKLGELVRGKVEHFDEFLVSSELVVRQSTAAPPRG